MLGGDGRGSRSSGKLSTRTARSGVYAFVWGQEGLMGGIGLDGSKITRVDVK